MLFGNQASAGMKPTTPTIGTATDGGTGTTVSVAFTPSTYIGKGTITYTATSSPGSLTGTGSGSPITVSGLTTGTAYTFTVRGTTNYGVASDSSAASNSVTPASPTAFDSIATVSGTGSSNTVTFSSIPGTYKSLQIRYIGKQTPTTAANLGNILIRFNSDTGTNYVGTHYIQGTGSSVGAGLAGTTSDTKITGNAVIPNSNAATYTNIFGVGIIDIIDYASTSKNKTVRSFMGADANSAGNGLISLNSGLWMSTSAITSISLICSSTDLWTSTSSFALYGIK